MKVATSIVLLILSLPALFVTAIPINLDGTGTTALSNGPRDFDILVLSLVKRSPIYWETASELTDNAGGKFPDDLGGRFTDDAKLLKLRTFHLAVIVLVKHLCSQDSKNHALKKITAERLEAALKSWRVSITTLRKFHDLNAPLDDEITAILAEIATARNVLEHLLSLNTLPSPIPAEIVDNLLKPIEDSLSHGSAHHVHIEEVVSHLQELLQYLETSNVGARHIIRPKLLTFGDWVGSWDNVDAKGVVEKKIRLCEEKADEMDRHLGAATHGNQGHH